MPHNRSPLFVRFPPILKYLLYAIPVWLVLSILVSFRQCVHELANPSAAAAATSSASATAQGSSTSDEYYICDGRRSKYPPSIHERMDYQWHFTLLPNKSKTIRVPQTYWTTVDTPEPADLTIELDFPLSEKRITYVQKDGEGKNYQLPSDRLYYIKNKEEKTTISVVITFMHI